MARIVPVNTYKYCLQYSGCYFKDQDFSFRASMPTSGNFWALLRVQAGASYPINSYYLSVLATSGTAGTFTLGQFNGGVATDATNVTGVPYNLQNFSLRINAIGLTITVFLNGIQILKYNFNGGANPGLYSGGIGFTALGLASGNYDIASVAVSQPR